MKDWKKGYYLEGIYRLIELYKKKNKINNLIKDKELLEKINEIL